MPADAVVWHAHAKVNLTLDVIARRADGYHELRSIMQPLALCDRIVVAPAPPGCLAVTSDSPLVPKGEANLVQRAAVLLQRRYAVKAGAAVQIEKRIPVAAGLAGGSADAAAALRALCRLWQLQPEDGALAELALQLGSDVPFCLLGRTALAEGRGERLTALPPAPALPVVVATPRLDWQGNKTAQVFGQLRLEAITERPDTQGMLRALAAADAEGIAACLGNVLEPAAVALNPVIARLKAAMAAAGAMGVSMTGAGPSVLALVSSETAAAVAAAARAITDLVHTTTLQPAPAAAEAGR